MLIPSEKAFALSKVKTLKDGGLDVHYEVTETVGKLYEQIPRRKRKGYTPGFA